MSTTGDRLFAVIGVIVAVTSGALICFNHSESTKLNDMVFTSVTEGSCIVSYKDILAGRSSFLRIDEGGSSEFVDYDYAHRILQHRRGTISRKEFGRVFGVVIDAGFFYMQDTYDIYPLPQGSDMVFEDIYYWVAVLDKTKEKTVLSHEHAAPNDLRQITAALTEIEPQLRDTQIYGAFIFAGSPEILEFRLSPETPLATIELDKEGLRQLRFFERALSSPFSLVALSALDKTDLQQLLPEGTRVFNVRFEGIRYTVKILERM